MARKYSLWDTKIGSRIDRFASEHEALAFVRTMIATYPREKLIDLSLNWRDDLDNVGQERTGEDLLSYAEGVSERRNPVGAGNSSYGAGTSGTSDHGGSNQTVAASGIERSGA